MAADTKGTVLVILFTCLVGSVVLNAVKEDPVGEDRERRIWAFALGACAFAAIVLFAH
jgi:hypothetical protein